MLYVRFPGLVPGTPNLSHFIVSLVIGPKGPTRTGLLPQNSVDSWSHGTCGDDDPPLVGGHVGRRWAILLIHVAVVVHGVGLACPHQLAAFAHTAVHGGIPRERKSHLSEQVTCTLLQCSSSRLPGHLLRFLPLQLSPVITVLTVFWQLLRP